MAESCTPIGLGTADLVMLLKESIGEFCTVSFRLITGLVIEAAQLIRVSAGRTVIRFSTPLDDLSGEWVMVAVPSRGLAFESMILSHPQPQELLLDYPAWATGPDKTNDIGIPMDLALRFSVDGQSQWYSGRTVMFGNRWICFNSDVSLPLHTIVDLTIFLPGQPLPANVQARIIRSNCSHHPGFYKSEILACSLQSETALARLLGLQALSLRPRYKG